MPASPESHPDRPGPRASRAQSWSWPFSIDCVPPPVYLTWAPATTCAGTPCRNGDFESGSQAKIRAARRRSFRNLHGPFCMRRGDCERVVSGMRCVESESRPTAMDRRETQGDRYFGGSGNGPKDCGLAEVKAGLGTFRVIRTAGEDERGRAHSLGRVAR